ncbi:alpha/beta hydrolase family protein [Piscinibacter terrae]|uniref:Alpha/beta fold hydrolase n=1 Tax=Piscinibacter terrae TaxID=2496871 RepID=A0A3N7JSQ7_9BURK|nr:alpha/beta hydrolase family protein [Albitalea terrae]RQP22025.1 alpha/beta fold hydrolase [Albitalea terrae]
MPRRSKRHDANEPKDETAPAKPRAAVYAPGLKAGFRATAQRVQDMHHAIADKTFGVLQKVPVVSLPARVVQGAHDAITDGVYAAVRAGGHAALSVAGAAEAMSLDPARRVGPSEQAVRSALNGVFGDHLAEDGSPLAADLDFHLDGAPLELDGPVVEGLQPNVLIFIHGLACDERSWFRRSTSGSVSEGSYGERLAAERPVSALYVRYNTGMPVEHNARRLGERIEALLAAAPQVRDLAIVGHSMGGLVARSACDLAVQDGASWLRAVSVLMCLGTPHRGAPLERLGHLASMALNLSKVTRPLAQVANARSRGIKDLRHGLRGQGAALSVPVRLLAARLADDDASPASAMMSALLGDGLVMPSSAADGDLRGDVQREELRGIGHMGLLNDARVYEIVRRWWDETRPALVTGAAPRG